MFIVEKYLQSGQIHYYCIFYIILQSWWKNFGQPCTGTMRVRVNLYTDPMICRHFVRLVHHISFTSSHHHFISTIVSADRHPTSERHSHLQQQRIVVLQSNLDYPDIDYPDFSIIRTFSLVPFFS